MRFPIWTAVPVLLFTLLAGCKSRAEKTVQAAEAPAVTVSTIEVSARPLTYTVPVTGTLVSLTRVDVKAETTGRVIAFAKEVGDRVRAGEVLLEVKKDDLQLGLRQTESGVQVAEAGLARAKVLASHAQLELERAQNLLKSGGITDKDYKLAVVTGQDARSQVAVADAQVAQARSMLEMARKKLSDTSVRAPVDGEIERKFVNTGAYVEPPTPVATLVDNNRLELEASLPSSQLAQVRSGMKVEFTVNSFPGVRFTGTVVDLSPAVDTESRSAKVRIRVPNPGGKLKAGMFADGEVMTGATSSAILIPVAALYRDEKNPGEAAVFLVENGKAAKRKVALARERDGHAEIAAGLKDGDRLIAEQSIELADGVRVRTREGGNVSQ